MGSLLCYVREGAGTSLQYSCLENPMDRGAWWAAVHGVAQSRTRLERLSSSSSSTCLSIPSPPRWKVNAVLKTASISAWNNPMLFFGISLCQTSSRASRSLVLSGHSWWASGDEAGVLSISRVSFRHGEAMLCCQRGPRRSQTRRQRVLSSRKGTRDMA